MSDDYKKKWERLKEYLNERERYYTSNELWNSLHPEYCSGQSDCSGVILLEMKKLEKGD